ncbi:sensor histidine kinase [Deinococcus sp. UYEF24]
MTLRLRLTLWYGTLLTVALTAVGLVGYGASVRDQYLTLDRVLVTSARLVETGIRRSGRSYALEADTAGPTKDGIVMVLRSYSPSGILLERSPTDPGLPETRPRDPLASPAPPAYQEVLPIALPWPGEFQDDLRAFGTLSVNGQRWRRYVVDVQQAGLTVGYVEALTPLSRLDESSLRLARILLNMTLLSVIVVLMSGWWLAGTALRPIERVIRAARSIASSEDLAQRVPTGNDDDEVGRLPLTFNEMLGRLQAAWQSQERFVGDASHELRAPLTVMLGNVALLRRHPALDAAERDEMLGEIESESLRLSRLVEDLLLLAQSDAGETLRLSSQSLREIAQEAIRDARKLASHHSITLDAADQPFIVNGDRDRLKQLLLILLDNAQKYSPAGSTIEVVLRSDGDSVCLSVRDQGRGIPISALPYIFDRFFRADPARQRSTGGAGLGLAIACWIAGQLGAGLRVQETGLHGTVFLLEFTSATYLHGADE